MPREPRLRAERRSRGYTLLDVIAWALVALTIGIALGQDVFARLWPAF